MVQYFIKVKFQRLLAVITDQALSVSSLDRLQNLEALLDTFFERYCVLLMNHHELIVFFYQLLTNSLTYSIVSSLYVALSIPLPYSIARASGV